MDKPAKFGDARIPTWARTVRRARREAEGLRRLGFEVREPEGFETPPHLRIAIT
jgi:hypothetical protein